MCDDSSNAKFFAIVLHLISMAINIYIAITKTIPYPLLFNWLADYGWDYVISVIVFEGLTLVVHVFEWWKCICCKCCDDKNRGCWTLCFDAAIACVLFLGFWVQVGFFVVWMTAVNDNKERMEDELYDDVTLFYGLPGRLSLTELINDIQRHERCCGVYDYVDYYNSTYANLPTYGGRVVPFTCYRIPEEGINAAGHEIDESEIYDTGCLEALIEVYNGYFGSRIWNFILTVLFDGVDLVRVMYNVCKVCCWDESEVSPELVLVRKAKSKVKEAHFVQVGPESWDWVRKDKSNDQEAHFVQVGPESSKLVRQAKSIVKEAHFVQVGPKPSVWVRKAKSNDQEAQHFVQVGPISLVWERKATLNDQEAHIVQVGPISSDG